MDPEVINTIFRAAHSFKGGGATNDFAEIADCTHLIETLLDEMRNGRRQATEPPVDMQLHGVDCLRTMLGVARGVTTDTLLNGDGLSLTWLPGA